MSDESSDEEKKPEVKLYDLKEQRIRREIKQAKWFPKLNPFRTAKYKCIKRLSKDLNPNLKTLFLALFASQKDNRDLEVNLNLQSLLPFNLRISEKMPSCNKQLQQEQSAYVCSDCGFFPTTIYCQLCFDKEMHKGHNYQKIQVGGGICDCGNSQNIKPQGFCPRHTGQIELPVVDPAQNKLFFTFFQALMQWILMMLKIDMYEPLSLFNHMVYFLDKLNTNSLHYNIMTHQFLMHKVSNGKTVLRNFSEFGSKYKDTNIATWTGEMLMKLLALDSFKADMCEEYIECYSTHTGYDYCEYKRLFMQLFSNADIVQKVIKKTKNTLDPRRKSYYDTKQYLNQLNFVDTIGFQTFKAVIIPILRTGGVQYNTLKQIQDKVQKGYDNFEQLIKDLQWQNYGYYELSINIAKNFRNYPQILILQMKNQYAYCKSYSFKQNKIIIPHHRSLIVQIFVYFKCDLMKVDPKELMKIFRFSQNQLVAMVEELLEVFLGCLREFALSFAYKQYERFRFDYFLDVYVKNKKKGKLFCIDCLGLKLSAMILRKMNKQQIYLKVLTKIFQNEYQKVSSEDQRLRQEVACLKEKSLTLRSRTGRRQGYSRNLKNQQFQLESMMMAMMGGGRPRQDESTQMAISIFQMQDKLETLHQVYFGQIVHLLFLLLECTLTERAEAIVSNDCLVDNEEVQNRNQRQMIKLFKNVKEVSIKDLQKINAYWFGQHFKYDKLIKKVARWSKSRNRYILKQNIQGSPICKILLHSFNIHSQIFKKLDQEIVQINEKDKILMQVMINKKILCMFMERMFKVYEQTIEEEDGLLIKEFAILVKLLGYVYGKTSDLFVCYKQKLFQIATRKKGESLSDYYKENQKQKKKVND